MLTDHLRPQQFTVYTKAERTEVIRQLKLVPDSKGEVEVFDIFWKMPVLNSLNFKDYVVPTFLVYAELSNSLDSRNREIAERIKKQYPI